MTAEALSAAEGPPRTVPERDAADIAVARQSVVDIVAARLVQAPPPDTVDRSAYPPADAASPDSASPDSAPPDAELDAEPAAAEVEPADESAQDESAEDESAADERGGAGSADGQWADAREPELSQLPEVEQVPVEEVAGAPADLAPEPPGDGMAEVVAEVLEPEAPTEADPRYAATAVLDVLRATGWADAEEARGLRAEADRLRELLDLVVRDHRAREASAAGLESQQDHWLVPLLRAAHGVAFGSLGAKVALRTAVQEVPEHILHNAGLRIDYGVEPQDAYDQ